MFQLRRFLGLALLSLAAVSIAEEAAAENPQLAFPGAEGFGRFARGGRGGDVYHVLNLDDSGPGSLRDGISSAKGPRTIVFDISGTITLESNLVINKSFLTIAGQTAPGDGIALRDHTFQIKNASDVIVRYIRIRLGDKNKPAGGDDTINLERVSNIMLDHISASWGVDGIMDVSYASGVTLQWSIFAEALNKSIHHKGEHAMLSSWRKLKGNATLHHNVLASSRNRHPTLGSSPETNPDVVIDFRNNVVYNWEGPTNLGNCKVEAVGNTYRPGPNTKANSWPMGVKAGHAVVHNARGYLRDNLFEASPDWSRDNYLAVAYKYSQEPSASYGSTTREAFESPVPFVAVADRPTTQNAGDASVVVLAKAGASLARDTADARLIAGIQNRTHRRIDSQDEVGGWPGLVSQPHASDRDRDGMPDAWEQANGLDADNPADRNETRDGFTNLEIYLNSKCR